jgi:hypothetical protein
MWMRVVETLKDAAIQTSAFTVLDEDVKTSFHAFLFRPLISQELAGKNNFSDEPGAISFFVPGLHFLAFYEAGAMPC